MTGQRESILISVAQVLRWAGVQHPLQRSARLDELRVGDAAVPADTEIVIDLVLEATGTAVVATGLVRTVATCACRRCLEPFEQPVVATIREIFEPRPTEGETYPLVSEHIDVVPLVRDAVLLSLPLAPLCRDECPGPAPERFSAAPGPSEDVAADIGRDHDAGPEPDRTEPPRDPRGAALDQLKLDR